MANELRPVLEALRRLELEVGRVMRRQSGEMDFLRDIRTRLEEMEKILRRATVKIDQHDEWERAAVDHKGSKK